MWVHPAVEDNAGLIDVKQSEELEASVYSHQNYSEYSHPSSDQEIWVIENRLSLITP